MEDIVKWCITAVCALLPAIAIYLVINVLSWKSGKKSAPRNEIAQPRQYLWVFVGSTVLWSAMALFALFMPEEMDANDSSTFGCIFSLVFAAFSLSGAIWFYRWRIVLGKKNLLVTSFFGRVHTNIPKYISGILVTTTVFTAVKNISVRFWMSLITAKDCGA